MTPNTQSATPAATVLVTLDDGTTLPVPAAVDQLTSVQVAIAQLEALEKQLKAALIETGLKEVCGTSTRAVISTSKASVTVAWKDVAAALNPSPELIAAHSTPKDPVTSVRIYGYN